MEAREISVVVVEAVVVTVTKLRFQEAIVPFVITMVKQAVVRVELMGSFGELALTYNMVVVVVEEEDIDVLNVFHVADVPERRGSKDEVSIVVVSLVVVAVVQIGSQELQKGTA